MIKLFHKLIMAASPVLLCGALLTGCTDDKYNKIDDLFQPRFVLDEPEVTGNSISLVWYEVNDAVSYTVEYYLDGIYRETSGIHAFARRCFQDGNYRNVGCHPLEEKLSTRPGGQYQCYADDGYNAAGCQPLSYY